VRVLWVLASPERSSLNGAMFDEGIRALRASGHECRVSDLYAMKWKAVVDRDDFPEATHPNVVVTAASQRAYRDGTLSPDIAAEHAKLAWADAVVFSFPLWWYGMPAILKGWFDRVFVQGYAYDVRDPATPGRSLRYGEGNLRGKRALVLLSCGSRDSAVGPRGISGSLEEVLFPLLHGTLWYTGMSVLPPVCVYDADDIDEMQFQAALSTVRQAVARLATARPLQYRYQNRGDYLRGVLRPDILPGQVGLSIHSISEPT
jgi:NAD(P)H dehydrogenase (quinone)